MSVFQYSAKDMNGRTVVGVVEAPGENEATAILQNKSYIVLSLKQVKAKALAASGQKIKLDDLVVFSRQLATMIDAGIPLVQALSILSEQVENKGLKAVVLTVRQDIEAGMSFCDALAKHPHVFSELFINMSRAGEASGMLDEVLDRLASYLEKSASLQRKVNSSLVYPAVVISMAFLITAVLLIKVVPTFKGIFDMLGGQLPLPTQILIMISDVVRKYFFLAIVAMGAVGYAFKWYISTPKGAYKFDAFQLKVPVLGTLFQKVAVAKFSRTFSTLVRSGVSVLNALDIVGKTSGNKVVEEAISECRVAVRDGEPIAVPLQRSKVFPPLVCRMIGVGEQTGQLEKMLTKIADFYDDQVDAAVAGMTSLIEPLVIALLGVLIGGIVIALFLPIFKITELIGK
ncbi:MAG TPA: type II secretion system F family protein [Candidatus Omnitrophota bacterium]|nr:type II secretion system F family protein [Candidatus Omnitrophota bacterium]HNQ51449.1 type II secretion system F family protein [Candidatus Omnitrophota bacterium]HQO38396.1 type II secretion system F family protein [Candidatus Omnitrophota bacterium]HQQ06497.1 type II secretion system F family protein [Candidatus Omnitrophota bacterium]